MHLALDVMGGDHAPVEPCRGALLACDQYPDLEISLVGPREKIEPLIEQASSVTRSHLHIVHTDEFIEMGESPSIAIRKKRGASLRLAMEMVRAKEADGCVSAGNTGAIVAGGVLVVGRIEGIDRPGLGVPIPGLNRTSLLLDIGATVICKPLNLYQFALMGSVYMESLAGVENPTVALLSNGSEEIKGNPLVLEAREMILKSALNFAGYVEGKDVPFCPADVMVCDGYTGNVLLKFAEGIGEVVYSLLKDEIYARFLPKMGLLFMLPTLKRIWARFDYENQGGSPLLGVDGTVIKAHGRSNARAIAGALRVARNFVEHEGVMHIEKKVAGGGI